MASWRTAPTQRTASICCTGCSNEHYRLATWLLAPSAINYRRFFDINELRLRVEDMGTFRAIHRLVGKLIATGQLHGLRLDHLTGSTTRCNTPRACSNSTTAQRAQNRSADPEPRDPPFYVTVEKILEEGAAGRRG